MLIADCLAACLRAEKMISVVVYFGCCTTRAAGGRSQDSWKRTGETFIQIHIARSAPSHQ